MKIPFLSKERLELQVEKTDTEKVKQFNVLDALPYINPMEKTPCTLEKRSGIGCYAALS